MPDTPPAPQPTTWVHRLASKLLPQFVSASRKGLIWFSSLGASGVLELCKQLGQFYGWTDPEILAWNNRMMLLQGIVLLVAKFWTDQIAQEDGALKTGLPPPAPGALAARVTTTVESPAPPPAPLPRGEGD